MLDKGKIEKVINNRCKMSGFTLYEWKFVGFGNNRKLVIYITKKGGITIDDCSNFSNDLADELDMRDLIDSRYILEVSSPGLKRELQISPAFSRCNR